MMTRLTAGILVGVASLCGPVSAQNADPAMTSGAAYVGPIVTKWGKAVTPENAWRSYPRPQLERPDWLNLNGSWDYAITKATSPQPKKMDGKILVPFAVESKLSGVARKVLPNERLWYRRNFSVPANWKGKRTLLHFGAVDYESQVFINGAPVGAHRGGSDPFSYDITEFLKSGANELVVHVSDPTSAGDQPRGKQTLKPQGIWYTAVTGIWQTVWLEAVPDLYIKEVRATPDIDHGMVEVEVALNNATSATDAVRLTASANGKIVASTLMRGNRRASLAIPDAHLWSPNDPFLYDLTAELVKIQDLGVSSGREARIAPHTSAEQKAYAAAKVQSEGGDKVTTYFGMRKISVGPNAQGRPVLLLNNKPLFQNGTLDQGWWPDGLLTPPSEEAARSDMVFLKKAGFNMLRKHIKVEPARYYYDADRLGILIWQDMPSGAMDDQSVRRQSDHEATFSSAAMAEYQSELARMIGALRAFPSIVMWVTNNEGWGQYDARTVAQLAKNMDPSRLVNAASGWMDVGDDSSDVFDIHTYEEVPTTPVAHGPRALVLGEYGGVGLAVPGHLWFPDRDLKIYQVAKTPEDYLARYKRKFEEVIRQAKEAGVSAAVYTQTTDVESELNGLLSYDREVEKFPAETFSTIAKPLFDE
ncbi:glycoside hydrolase family 2 protein [Steroidobacter flavus]|uniref:Glycoside hydrolase family 2 protein n=1 Tax=Steroidobacter flavus TaxID=1842136 RepID=A0ABV8SZ86_9GAMM